MSLSTKYKVVFDTNVFVSGLVYGGNCEKILRLFKDEQIELLISPQTHTEVLGKLPNFGLSSDYIDEQDAQIQTKTTKILPKKIIKASRDPKDIKLSPLSRPIFGQTKMIFSPPFFINFY